MNGVAAYKMSDGTYRAIVKPSTEARTLNGSYKTKDDRTINYEGNSYPTVLAAGNCYTLNVDSPLPGDGSTERALAPGDFVFQNETEARIEIYPGDGPLTEDGNTKIPDYANAVGVVVTCDPARLTDAECNKQHWNHAYVMGLTKASTGNSWGMTGTNQDFLTDYTTENGADNMNGYTETELMVTKHAGNR